MKSRVAIVSTNRNKYSETFIHNHLRLLPFDNFYLFGGYLPKFWSKETTGNSYKLKVKLIDRIGAYSLRKKELKKQHQLAVRQFIEQQKVDLVLAEYGPSGVEMAPICEQLNIPLIVHFHGYDAYRADMIEFYADQYREMFDKADFVIGVSQHMCKQLINLGLDESKLRYNPYGPDPELFSPCEAGKNKLIYCGVARFAETKGHFLTLEAFKKVVAEFPEAELVLIGDGHLELPSKVLAKAYGIEENVKFLGVMPHKKVGQFMQKSRVFVQHSMTTPQNDTEGTPVSIIEASATALPVVATKHAGIPDVVKDGKSGFLVNEGDINGMAEAMLKFARNAELATTMGEAGRKIIEKQFTLDLHIDRLSNLIRESVANR